MHVLLLRPHYATHARPTGYPIGLGYLAGYLESKGHQATILDLALETDWKAAIRKQLEGREYDLLGVDYNHKVAGVEVRGEDGAVLATNDHRDLGGQSSEDDALRVHDVPLAVVQRGLGVRQKCFHHSFP